MNNATAVYTSNTNRQKKQLDDLKETIQDRLVRGKFINSFITQLNSIDSWQDEFDKDLWNGIVDHVTIKSEGDIVFTFIGDVDVKL